jgi:hypothetical protein
MSRMRTRDRQQIRFMEREKSKGPSILFEIRCCEQAIAPTQVGGKV